MSLLKLDKQLILIFFLGVLCPIVSFGQTSDTKNNKFSHTCLSKPLLETSKNSYKSEYQKINETVRFRKPLSDFITSFSKKYHFNKTELDCLFDQVELNHTAIRLMRPAVSRNIRNWQTYQKRMIEQQRISVGVQFWNKYEKDLSKAEEKYGIPAYIIVGIIGIETIYGRDTGHFRTIDTLTSLAFDYPDSPNQALRKEFFRNELENLLLLASETNTDPLTITGSFAGAIGIPQFMPGSIRKYAVDFDEDGKVDLQHSAVDAIGSVANFLQQHGWKSAEPIIFPAKPIFNCSISPDSFRNQDLVAKYSVNDLNSKCISTEANVPSDKLYGIIDLENGELPVEYWLGTNNFYAITQYNRSYFYAMSVIHLGQKVYLQKNN